VQRNIESATVKIIEVLGPLPTGMYCSNIYREMTIVAGDDSQSKGFD